VENLDSDLFPCISYFSLMNDEQNKYVQIPADELSSRTPEIAMLPMLPQQVAGLPYRDLNWKDFESLIFLITCERYRIENCTPYGLLGQQQQGLDILVSLPAGAYHVYQCKKVESFTGGELRSEFSRFEKGDWFTKTKKYFLASSSPLQQTTFVDEWELLKTSHAGQLDLTRLGAHELDQELKDLPALVARFFSLEHARHFCDPIAFGAFVKDRLPQPELPVHGKPQHYIPRTIERAGTEESATISYPGLMQAFLKTNQSGLPNILIRSNAAYGKTTEIRQMLYQLGTERPQMLCLLLLLKNFQPRASTIARELDQRYPNWNNYEGGPTVLVLDGLDEVPADHFPAFLHDLRSFLSFHSSVRLICSIRSNFYNPDFLGRIAGSRTFTELYLSELSQQEISDFCSTELGQNRSAQFISRCEKNRMADLLHIPFYLINLCELERKPVGAFPQNRNQAMEKIIANRCREDSARSDMRFQADEIFRTMQKLAVITGLQGRNTILLSEIRRHQNLDLQLLKFSSLLTIEVSELDHRIGFVHANFQEFLLARTLMALPEAQCLDILFGSEEPNRLRSKFVNVANYVFSMVDKGSALFQEIFKRVATWNAETLALFEKDKIALEDRLDIFDGILASYHRYEYYFIIDALVSAERLWEYVDHDLLSFHKVLAKVNTGLSASCASYMDIVKSFPLEKMDGTAIKALNHTLLELIRSDYEYYIHDRAIDLLSDFRCFSEANYQVMLKSRHLSHKLVRAAVFDYLVNWGVAERELDFLLNSYPENRISAGLEIKYVRTLTILLNAQNFRKILGFLISKGKPVTKIFRTAGYSKHILNNFYTRLGALYTESEHNLDIEELSLEFFRIMDEHQRSHSGGIIHFYMAFGKPLEGLLKLLEKGYDALAWIDAVDAGLLAELLLRYQVGQIDKKVIYEVRGGLRLEKGQELHDAFQKILLDRFPGEFEYDIPIDYEAGHRMRRSRDYQLVDSKALFLKEAEDLFATLAEITGKTNPDWEDFSALEFSERREIKAKYTSNLVINTIRENKFKGDINALKELVTSRSWRWEDYRYNVVFGWLCYRADPPVPDHLRSKVAAFFNKRAMKFLDLEHAITESPDGKYTINRVAIQYEVLVRQGVLKPKKGELSELLLKDHDATYHRVGDESHLRHPGPLYQVVFKLIEDPDFFSQAIKSHLSGNRVHTNAVMLTYMHIIGKYKLVGMDKELLDTIRNPKWNDRVKNMAVKVWLATAPQSSEIHWIIGGLSSICQKWHWRLVSHWENQTGTIGQYISLAEKQLPVDILEMEGWQSELVEYGLKQGSRTFVQWFFDQLKIERNFDCNDQKAEIWTQLISENAPDVYWVLEIALSCLDAVVTKSETSMWCKRKKIIQLLLSKNIQGNAERFERVKAVYGERILFHQEEYPAAKEHVRFLRALEDAYYLEKPEDFEPGLITEVLAVV
jgi:hypothetical protein